MRREERADELARSLTKGMPAVKHPCLQCKGLFAPPPEGRPGSHFTDLATPTLAEKHVKCKPPPQIISPLPCSIDAKLFLPAARQPVSQAAAITAGTGAPFFSMRGAVEKPRRRRSRPWPGQALSGPGTRPARGAKQRGDAGYMDKNELD